MSGIEKIYRHFAIKLTRVARDKMQAWLKSKPKARFDAKDQGWTTVSFMSVSSRRNLNRLHNTGQASLASVWQLREQSSHHSLSLAFCHRDIISLGYHQRGLGKRTHDNCIE